MSYFIPDPRWEMPELLIPGRKPTGAVEIDWSHPLAPDYYCISINGVMQMLTAEKAIAFGGDPTGSKGGVYFDGVDDYATLPNIPETGLAHTLFCNFSLHSKNNGGQSGVEGVFSSGQWGNDAPSDTRIRNAWSTNDIRFQYGGPFVSIAHSSFSVDTDLMVVGRSQSGEGSLYMWENNQFVQKVTNSSDWSTIIFSGTRPITVAAYPGNESNTESVMTFFSGGLYTRTLTDGQCRSLGRNPYQFLIPK